MGIKLILLFSFLCFTSCSSNKPTGHVVSETGVGVFHVKYTGQQLNVGDKVKIIKMDSKDSGEYSPPASKTVIGEGRVSSILHDNYYEIKSETAHHIPKDALIEKF